MKKKYTLYRQGSFIFANFAGEKHKTERSMEAENFRQQLRKTCMEFIVLQTIKQQRRYAPDIIAELRKANLIVVEGTIYPMLTRLKNNGILGYEWEESTQGPPRKYYSLTPLGMEYADALDREWKNINSIIRSLNKNTK